MADMRHRRDVLMAQTDWTQMPDAPLSDSKKAEFATYRQALRDIPQTYSNPDDVVWPEKPTI
ncbi:phage tail assembly chaperone [Vibrio parahaemolyticus]|nr:phage tail assembly chaperone [Vibrio parahaemolyticus]MBM5050449.1 phage tail assembly chaperone [Vibrio parahaemolyticus]MBM5077895.1 phage tail assembly chaperone [Vibrio parahaemolyticus]